MTELHLTAAACLVTAAPREALQSNVCCSNLGHMYLPLHVQGANRLEVGRTAKTMDLRHSNVCNSHHLVLSCLWLQVEARDKARRKHRKAKNTSKPSKAGSDEHAAGAGSDGGREQRHGSPSKSHKHPAAAAAATAGGQHHSSTDPSMPSPDERRDGPRASSTAGNQIVLSDPTAAFVLVATQEFVRVYSIGHAVSADRTTMRKVAMQGTLQFASAFVACGAPALACLLEMEGEIHLQVRADSSAAG